MLAILKVELHGAEKFLESLSLKFFWGLIWVYLTKTSFICSYGNHGSHFPRKTFDRLFDMTQKKIFCQMIIIGCGGDGVAARHDHIKKNIVNFSFINIRKK